jgi:hypothetical protein
VARVDHIYPPALAIFFPGPPPLLSRQYTHEANIADTSSWVTAPLAGHSTLGPSRLAAPPKTCMYLQCAAERTDISIPSSNFCELAPTWSSLLFIERAQRRAHGSKSNICKCSTFPGSQFDGSSTRKLELTFASVYLPRNHRSTAVQLLVGTG